MLQKFIFESNSINNSFLLVLFHKLFNYLSSITKIYLFHPIFQSFTIIYNVFFVPKPFFDKNEEKNTKMSKKQIDFQNTRQKT